MIAAPLLHALAAGIVVLIAMLIAWKINAKPGSSSKRNLVIVIDGKMLKALVR